MRTSSVLLLLAGSTVVLAACDRPSDQQLQPNPSVASESIKAAPNNVTAPPLPINTDVNAAAAENQSNSLGRDVPSQPDKNGADQSVNVAAQDAAAKSPDTASADAAKNKVVEDGENGSNTGGTNKNSYASQGDELTKGEENSAMPKPGQANDHSAIKPGQQ